MCSAVEGRFTLDHAHIRYVTQINSQGQHYSSPRVNAVDHACIRLIFTMPWLFRSPWEEGTPRRLTRRQLRTPASTESSIAGVHHLAKHHGGLQPHVPGASSVAASAQLGSGRRLRRLRSARCPEAPVPEEKVVQLQLAGVPGAADLAVHVRGSGPGYQHRGDHRHDPPW